MLTFTCGALALNLLLREIQDSLIFPLASYIEYICISLFWEFVNMGSALIAFLTFKISAAACI